MNREIEFRGFYESEYGKEIIYIDNKQIKGRWIYGYYEETCTCILKPPMTACCIRDIEQSLYNVICKTVGQYTGLKDKNGKKIFEGDVVRNIYSEFKYIISYENTRAGFVPFCKDEPETFNDECEVIGTIFDKEYNNEK